MSASQASVAAPNLLKTKRYWRNMALAVIAAVAITVILTSQLVNVTQANSNPNSGWYSPGPHTVAVMSESIVLNPNGSYLTGFNVPDEAQNAILQGNYTVVSNSTNGAIMTIWTQQEFLNYFGCRHAVPCYNKDLIPMRSDNLNITLSKGNYLILISGASINTDILEAQLTLNFTI